MALRALIRRAMGAGDVDTAWEQTGRVTSIPVDSAGWQRRAVSFPAAFPSAPNFILTSIYRSSPGQPSGLKVFLHPSAITTAGFNLNIDVNASCTISGAYIDVCWLARRI